MTQQISSGLEHKFCRFDGDVSLEEGCRIEGYASLFGRTDQGGDVVAPGAYKHSLERLNGAGRAVARTFSARRCAAALAECGRCGPGQNRDVDDGAS